MRALWGAAVLVVTLTAACSGADDGGGAGITGETLLPNGPGTDHALGPEQAPVVLLEYADFQ